MIRHLIKIFFLVIFVGILAVPHLVHAFPPLPSSYYGLVTRDGVNLPEGVTIEAVIDDQVYASNTVKIYEGDAVYSLVVPGDDPATEIVEGGIQGDTIYFRVDGVLADQTAVWQSGSNTKLDLTFPSDNNQPTSAPSNTPTTAPTRTPTRTSTAVPTRTQTSFPKTQETNPPPATSTLQPATESEQRLTQQLTTTADQALTLSPAADPTTTPIEAARAGLQDTDEDPPTSNDLSDPVEKQTPNPSEPPQQGSPPIGLWIGLAAILLMLLTGAFLYFRKNRSTNESLL